MNMSMRLAIYLMTLHGCSSIPGVYPNAPCPLGGGLLEAMRPRADRRPEDYSVMGRNEDSYEVDHVLDES